MTEKIHSNIIDEDCIKYVHPCGVTVFMCPMEGFSTVTAQFSVRFGSEDNCYVKDGVKITIPDGTAHYLEHKLFESEEKGAFEFSRKREHPATPAQATTTPYTISPAPTILRKIWRYC